MPLDWTSSGARHFRGSYGVRCFGCAVADRVRRTRKFSAAAKPGSSTIKHWPDRGEGLLLAPGTQRIGSGAFLFPLQFEDADGQVAEAGQDGGAFPVGGAAGIFTESYIAPVVGSVFAA